MAYFILLHGFNDRTAGRGNIDRVAPLLEAQGHAVEKDDTVDYGWLGLLGVRLRKHRAVLRIVRAIRMAVEAGHEVLVVGYSNGCNYGLKALRLVFVGRVKLVLVHPALPTTFELPPSVSRYWVCYTSSDWAVRAASWVHWLIPGWGRAGAVGYRGHDDRVVNVDYSDVARGHGGLWKDDPLETFATDLDRLANLD